MILVISFIAGGFAFLKYKSNVRLNAECDSISLASSICLLVIEILNNSLPFFVKEKTTLPFSFYLSMSPKYLAASE